MPSTHANSLKHYEDDIMVHAYSLTCLNPKALCKPFATQHARKKRISCEP